MATRSKRGSNAEEFRISPADYGYPDAPGFVLVQVAEGIAGEKFAILAGGDHGRYSLDFRLENGAVDIERAYDKGKRVEIAELPGWVGAVEDGIAERAFTP